MEKYNPQEIEKKWQKFWEKTRIYQAEDFSKKLKKYLLVEFPYPSAEGLHVGHCRSYSAMDAIARKKRMEGYNVLFPIGWDAFGLPTENYALRTGVHPEIATKRNVANFKRQLKSLGLSFDWLREINTTDPEYYKWTQWIFLKLFEKGLAYQAEIPINFCPKCKIGLADEEVIGGRHERCGEKVIRKKLKQWMLKITKYAQRLIDDLEKVDYLEKIKAQQINWIGRSEGTNVKFQILNSKFQIEVFTTRIDTIFGVVAIVLAPEHSLIENLKSKIENWSEVEKYIKASSQKTEFERTQLERIGVPLKGILAINPVNNEKIPLWLADYVIGTYGGGAVMLVPGHDKRDYDFAKRYGLEIREVIRPIKEKPEGLKRPFVEDGILINSGRFSGLTSEKARKEITKWLEKKKWAKRSIQYKLRDWVFSRQHYWGEPIPIIYCRKCWEIRKSKSKNQKLKLNQDYTIIDGKEYLIVPVPEKDLPVKLPFVEKYQPTGTGESPLANINDWVNTKCPKCGAPAKRETDTMPNWAGSNWYFLRYCDPKNDKELASFKKLKYWLPVDWYNGGFEHTTLHLLYSRFIYKFLYDIGVVPGPEPYQKRTSHGIVLGEDGRKMSKSFGNVINPDEIVREYGADTLRVYELFMGPFEQAISWSSRGVKGAFRFLKKVWNLKSKVNFQLKIKPQRIERLIHKTIKKVSEDLENCKFNTAISSLMILANQLEKEREVSPEHYSLFLVLLFPFAPHIAEELWHLLGHRDLISNQPWPKYDPKLIKEEIITLLIQINGKVRDKVEVEAGIGEEEAKEIAFSREKIKKWLEAKTIKKIIFVPQRLINLVTKEK